MSKPDLKPVASSLQPANAAQPKPPGQAQPVQRPMAPAVAARPPAQPSSAQQAARKIEKKPWDGPARTRLPEQIRGVLYVTGLKATGKTGLAVTADHPENVLLWDWENKGDTYADQMGLGGYINMNEEAAKFVGDPLLVQKADHFKAIKKVAYEIINEPRYTVLVIDTGSELQSAYADEIQRYATKYGVDSRRQGGAFGGIWPEVSAEIGKLFSFLRSYGYIKLIVVVEHLSDYWSTSGPVPNKYKLAGAKVFFRLSTLQLIMSVPEPGPPAGLVVAENVNVVSQEGLSIKRCLPARLPVCDWKSIYRYLESPADLLNPAEGEKWTEDELSMYGDRLSKAQLDFLKLSMEAQIARSKMGEGE